MNITHKKKVVIIGTNGLPANYGGFETLVANIHKNIAKNHDLTVYCSNRVKKVGNLIGKTRLVHIPLSANGWQSFFYDFLSIVHALFYADVFIILGLGGGLALPILKLSGKKIIYNPGGVETSKVRGSNLTSSIEIKIKRAFDHGFFRLSQKIVLDNEAFFDQLNLYSEKLCLIEYGGEDSTKEDTEQWQSPFPEYDISVSRAQEDMNIHMVLEAYSKSKRNLIMISNWETSEYGQKLKFKYQDKYPNIMLHEAVYEKPKLNAMRSKACLYVHSHMLCGTAPSLVEAMSLNLGVICFDVPTNRYTTEGKAMYFKSAQDLESKIKWIRQEEIDLNRSSMKKIADKRYSWKLISEKYLKLI